MNKEITEFVIYVINELANRYNLYPSMVYREMEKTQCIQRYLIPLYDVLHTLNSETIVDDVQEYLRSRGAEI